jgi:hypothetical protein
MEAGKLREVQRAEQAKQKRQAVENKQNGRKWSKTEDAARGEVENEREREMTRLARRAERE